ncbi:MAG TPA: hypothetical protein VL027_02730 [Spongiibacteraceae bacterium]|nr:hypothetical protein [Spongiibacteraceae bacterium]
MPTRLLHLLLALFIAMNGVVLAGERTVHLVHDNPGVAETHHAQHHLNGDNPADQDLRDCNDTHHNCHTHAPQPPVNTSACCVGNNTAQVWPLSADSTPRPLHNKPPVPPPTA